MEANSFRINIMMQCSRLFALDVLRMPYSFLSSQTYIINFEMNQPVRNAYRATILQWYL